MMNLLTPKVPKDEIKHWQDAPCEFEPLAMGEPLGHLMSKLSYSDWENIPIILLPHPNPLSPTTPTAPDYLLTNPMFSGNYDDWTDAAVWDRLLSPRGHVTMMSPTTEDVKCFGTSTGQQFPEIADLPTPPPELKCVTQPAVATTGKPKRKKRIWEPRPSPYELRSGRVVIFKIEKMEEEKPELPIQAQEPIPAVVLYFLGERKQGKKTWKMFV